MKKSFFGLCMLTGFMIILGTAGASDIGLIEFKDIVAQGLIGLGISTVGFFGFKLTGADF